MSMLLIVLRLAIIQFCIDVPLFNFAKLSPMLLFRSHNVSERCLVQWLSLRFGRWKILLNCKTLRCKGLCLLFFFSLFLRPVLAENLASIQGCINICCTELIDGKSNNLSKVIQRDVMARLGQGSSDFQNFPRDKCWATFWHLTYFFSPRRISLEKKRNVYVPLSSN